MSVLAEIESSQNLRVSQNQLRSAIERVRAGDEEAYGEIMDHFRGLLIAVGYNYLANFELAQELAQTALVRGFFALQKRKRIKNLKAWLVTVVKNLCLDWLRKNHPPQLSIDEIGEPSIGISSDKQARPDEQLLRKEQRVQIAKAFSALPAEQRRALVLKYVKELSYEEIAALMKISLPKLKSLLYRARLGFRQRLLSGEGKE